MNTTVKNHNLVEVHRVRNRVESASIIINLAADGTVISANKLASAILGEGKETLSGKNFSELACWHMNPDFAQTFNACLSDAREGIRKRMPAKLINANDSTVWMELSIAGQFDNSGRVSSVVVEGHDITSRVLGELNRAQQTQRLTQLSRKLLAAQEEERRRISQKLHDQIGQSLTALRLGLHNVQNRVEDEDTSKLISENMKIVEQVLAQIRNLSLDLRPAMLDDLGLIAALEWSTARHSELTGLDLRFDTDLVGMRWSSSIEVALFRVAQEAIANAMRHSESPRIDVALYVLSDCLELTIKDYGGGFCAEGVLERATEGQSLGIVGMQQRIALVNGNIEFESSGERGTIVKVRVPIN